MIAIHDIDVWRAGSKACWAADDDFVVAKDLQGVQRYYRVFEDDAEIFIGTISEFENAFGGIQGRETGLFACAADRDWKVKVIDTDQSIEDVLALA